MTRSLGGARFANKRASFATGRARNGIIRRINSRWLPTPSYTTKEGQYLAFIYYYTKLHRAGPAEHDMQVYFQATPPAVHDMVVKLEKHGFISREPGEPRSICLLLRREELPDLE